MNEKIYIAGHNGLVGSSILKKFRYEGYKNIVYKDSKELDLRNQFQVENFFKNELPNIVIIAAAKVGGIKANNEFRATFLYDNLMIESNIIHSAFIYGVQKLIFLGSSCIYPKFAKQPIKEEYLFTDTLEYTNEPYAIAKIAGIKLCENYFKQHGSNFYSIMPTNIYGPNDNFNLETSHVLPALIRKIHEAKFTLASNTSIVKPVTIWGSGKPKREFLYVDDLADAVYHLYKNVNANNIYDQGISHINIGTGKEISISELVKLISSIIGFKGEIDYDTNKPDGTPRKLLDVTRITNLGWKYSTKLENGIKKTYDWYLNNIKRLRI